MFRFYLQTVHPDSWQDGLVDPEKQWKVGFSVRTLANCWEMAAASSKLRGFPPEVKRLFAESDVIGFPDIEPLLGLVEHQVSMPGRGFQSDSDLFVLAKANGQLVSIVVEGKVEESFGNQLQEWNDGTPNRQTRLTGILDILGLPSSVPDNIYYQLLHRMTSAVSEAKRFGASSAVMLIHSFSPNHTWLNAYQDFLALYGKQGDVGELVFLRAVRDVNLYAGWVHGDEKYLKM